MSKPNLLSAATMAAALLLTTPAMAPAGSTNFTAPHRERAYRDAILRRGKPAAEIAPVICVVLGSAMCGTTGAPITGQCFPPCLKPKISRNKRNGRQQVRSNTFSQRTDLVHNLSERISHEFPASTGFGEGEPSSSIRVRRLAPARRRCARGISGRRLRGAGGG